MERKHPLLHWTPEIYFVLFAGWWITGNAIPAFPVAMMQTLNMLPLGLLVVFLFYLLLRQRWIGILFTLSGGLISLVLTSGLIYVGMGMHQFSGPLLSILFFGALVLITNFTMLIWMARKYRLVTIQD